MKQEVREEGRMGEIDTSLQGAPQWVKGCTKFRLPLPPSSQPLCLVEVGQRGREMWCMNSFLESSDCTLQGTCSVGNTVQCVTCTVDVDISTVLYSV